MSVIEEVIAECYGTTPTSVCKLLYAMAGSEDAKRHRHDIVLLSAAKMIEAFEKRAVR